MIAVGLGQGQDRLFQLRNRKIAKERGELLFLLTENRRDRQSIGQPRDRRKLCADFVPRDEQLNGFSGVQPRILLRGVFDRCNDGLKRHGIYKRAERLEQIIQAQNLVLQGTRPGEGGEQLPDAFSLEP